MFVMSALSLSDSEVLSYDPEVFEADGHLTYSGNNLRAIQAGYRAATVLRKLNFWHPELIRTDRIRSEGVAGRVIETEPLPMGVVDDRATTLRLTLATGRLRHFIAKQGTVATDTALLSRGVLLVGAEIHAEGLPPISAVISPLQQGSDTMPSLAAIRQDKKQEELTNYMRAEFVANNVQSAQQWLQAGAPGL